MSIAEQLNQLIPHYMGVIMHLTARYDAGVYYFHEYCRKQHVHRGVCGTLKEVYGVGARDSMWTEDPSLYDTRRNAYWCCPPLLCDTRDEILIALQRRVDKMELYKLNNNIQFTQITMI